MKKKPPQPKNPDRLKTAPKRRTPKPVVESITEAAVKYRNAPASQAGVELHEWGYRPKCRGWLYQSVCSPYWRLYYNSRSGHSIQVGGGMLALGPEHFVLIPPQCIFHCHGVEPAPHFWIHFSYPRPLVQSPPKPVLIPPREADLKIIRALQISRIEQSYPTPTEKDLFLGMGLVHAILTRQELAWMPALPDALQKILVHIEKNFCSELTNGDLAKIGGLSEAGLARIFKKYLHTSPTLHVLHLRVQKVGRLLKTTQESIDQIADATGFYDRFHLSKIFKKITGKTPSQFRKENQAR